MTPKAEKIKEAWIAEIGEEKYNEVKHLIDKEGYMDNSTDPYLKMGDFKADKTVDYYDNEILRPKSLNNVSTNNGWNRIDEVGLPSEEGSYNACRFQHGKWTHLENISLIQVRLAIQDLNYTHWRKKEVYPNPLY